MQEGILFLCLWSRLSDSQQMQIRLQQCCRSHCLLWCTNPAVWLPWLWYPGVTKASFPLSDIRCSKKMGADREVPSTRFIFTMSLWMAVSSARVRKVTFKLCCGRRITNRLCSYQMLMILPMACILEQHWTSQYWATEGCNLVPRVSCLATWKK